MKVDEAVAVVKDAFPGAEEVALSEGRDCLVSAHCIELWGNHEGIAALAHGVPAIINGRYRHRGFRPRFYTYPDQLAELSRDAVELSNDQDVWLCPMLRSSCARNKNNGLGGRYGWADLDGEWTPERAKLLTEIATPGTMLIDSGTGHHLYVRVEEWSSVADIVRLNLGLRGVLGGDAKHQNESLLRTPGTLNHKPRAFGYGKPRLVVVEEAW